MSEIIQRIIIQWFETDESNQPILQIKRYKNLEKADAFIKGLKQRGITTCKKKIIYNITLEGGESEKIKLEDWEYNLLQTITSLTKTDCWFWLKQDEEGNDYVYDLENDVTLEWPEAMQQLDEAVRDCRDTLNLTDDQWADYDQLYLKLTKKLN